LCKLTDENHLSTIGAYIKFIFHYTFPPQPSFVFQMLIPNLTVNTWYEIKIQGASRSIFDKKQINPGRTSEPRKVQVRPNCDKIQTFMRSSTRELSAGVIAGAVCVLVALLFGFLAMIMWKKFFRAAYYYLDDPPRPQATLVDWDSRSDSADVKTGVPVHLFSKHVAELHADGDIGFSKEYEAIQAASAQEEYPSEHSQHTDNKTKNRYLNIIACEW
jgi:receptor-type tyrosine-protein phosphatase gamma